MSKYIGFFSLMLYANMKICGFLIVCFDTSRAMLVSCSLIV
jgi:hypothetical protein